MIEEGRGGGGCYRVATEVVGDWFVGEGLGSL